MCRNKHVSNSVWLPWAFLATEVKGERGRENCLHYSEICFWRITKSYFWSTLIGQTIFFVRNEKHLQLECMVGAEEAQGEKAKFRTRIKVEAKREQINTAAVKRCTLTQMPCLSYSLLLTWAGWKWLKFPLHKQDIKTFFGPTLCPQKQVWNRKTGWAKAQLLCYCSSLSPRKLGQLSVGRIFFSRVWYTEGVICMGQHNMIMNSIRITKLLQKSLKAIKNKMKRLFRKDWFVLGVLSWRQGEHEEPKVSNLVLCKAAPAEVFGVGLEFVLIL